MLELYRSALRIRHAELLLASSPLDGCMLPPDCAVWLRTG